MGFVLRRDFTLLSSVTPVVLDVLMSLILSLITMNDTFIVGQQPEKFPRCIPSSYHSGDMLRYCHRDIIFCMT